MHEPFFLSAIYSAVSMSISQHTWGDFLQILYHIWFPEEHYNLYEGSLTECDVNLHPA